MNYNGLIIRPLTDEDVTLLTTWLYQDYVLKWFDNPQDWLAEVNGRQNEYNWIHHFIVMHGDIPIGFCQYYDCFDSNEDWFTITRAGDTYSIDYLIGKKDYLNKGYGKSIIRLLTETVRRNTTATQIIVQPDTENHASNHVLLANGYVFDEANQYYRKLL